MLTNLFLQIFHMGITAGIVICVVLLIRGTIFAKFPKKYAYLLWIVVGIRLACPFEIPSPVSGLTLPWSDSLSLFSLQQMAETTEEEAADEKDTANQAGLSGGGNVVSAEKSGVHMRPVPSETEQSGGTLTGGKGILHEEETGENMLHLLAVLWLAGSSLIIMYNFILYLRMKRHLQRGVRYRDNIYECEGISGPFVIGIRKPVVYIPFRLGEEEREYILQHEMFHIKRHDNLVKLLAFLLVAVYWFQPLVWVAWIYMVRDMEMSCDEHILSKADKAVRKQYSLSLLAFAANERKYSAELLHFGEKNVKRRIRYIMNMKESKKWLGGLAAALIVIVGAVCLTFFGNTAVQEKAGAEDKITDNVDSAGYFIEEEKNEEIVLAEGKAGPYVVQVVVADAVYVEDELSIFNNTYYGKFNILVKEDDQIVTSYSYVHNGDNFHLNLPQGETITLRDYDGDGLENNFAIGQIVSSSAKEYQFYALTDEGVVMQIYGNVVADGGYFQVFEAENGKVKYQQYNQKKGKYINKTAQVGEPWPKSINKAMIEKTGDVTGDGIADTIQINGSAADTSFAYGSPVLTVTSGKSGKVIYTLDNYDINAAVHPGYNSYYLYHGEKQDYLLMWNPVMYQGAASYVWRIFSLDENGKEQMLEKGEFSFDENRPKKSDVKKLKEFEANLNKRLKRAELLIDTIDGELKTDESDTAYLYDATETIEDLKFFLDNRQSL